MTAVAAGCLIDIVPRHFSQRRNAAKVLARMSGATERAAKNWLAKRNAPQGEHLLALMASCEEIEADILQLIGHLRSGRP